MLCAVQLVFRASPLRVSRGLKGFEHGQVVEVQGFVGD